MIVVSFFYVSFSHLSGTVQMFVCLCVCVCVYVCVCVCVQFVIVFMLHLHYDRFAIYLEFYLAVGTVLEPLPCSTIST